MELNFATFIKVSTPSHESEQSCVWGIEFANNSKNAVQITTHHES